MGFAPLPQAHDPDHKQWTPAPSAGEPRLDRQSNTFSAPTSDHASARYTRNHLNAQASLAPAPLTDPAIPQVIRSAAFDERCHRALAIAHTYAATPDFGERPALTPPNGTSFFAKAGDVLSAYRCAVDCISRGVHAPKSVGTPQAEELYDAAVLAARLTVGATSRYNTDNLKDAAHEAAAIEAAWHVLEPHVTGRNSNSHHDGHEWSATPQDDAELIQRWAREFDHGPGIAEWGELRIKNQPLTHQLPLKLRKSRRPRLTDAGACIRRPERIITDGKAFGQVRRHKSKVGTLLVDTSGSMHLSRADILEIMAACPAVTIATYSGSNHIGELWVVAKHGKYAHDRLEPHYGGNVVDGPSLDWLAAQPGPRVWVSDAMVTGSGDVTSTALLIDALAKVKRSNIVRYHNVQNLIADLAEPTP